MKFLKQIKVFFFGDKKESKIDFRRATRTRSYQERQEDERKFALMPPTFLFNKAPIGNWYDKYLSE